MVAEKDPRAPDAGTDRRCVEDAVDCVERWLQIDIALVDCAEPRLTHPQLRDRLAERPQRFFQHGCSGVRPDGALLELLDETFQITSDEGEIVDRFDRSRNRAGSDDVEQRR